MDRRQARSDPRVDEAARWLVPDQLLPQRSGGGEYLYHTVERRTGRFWQGQDKSLNGR